MHKKNLLNFSIEELKNEMVKLKQPKYRAEQIFISINKNNVNEIKDIKGIPDSLKQKLEDEYCLLPVKIIKVTNSLEYNTQKFLFELGGKYLIETVLISENERNTICISTQVGCNVGCEFCATGKMGFKKNLDVSEIISQVYEVKRLTGITPTNIVYMGMGEPFLNYDNLINSLKILTHSKGLGLTSKRITVSTVGFKGKIKNFADDIMKDENKSLRRVKLALSLHTTDNGLREMLIPTSVKNKLPDLYEEISYFYKKTGNKITYEYIYFEGLNDTQNDINRLVKISRLVPSNINIIPFHPINFKLNKPLNAFNNKKDIPKLLSNQKLNDFIDGLKSGKVTVNLRNSSGVDINAACGQLAAFKEEKSI